MRITARPTYNNNDAFLVDTNLNDREKEKKDFSGTIKLEDDKRRLGELVNGYSNDKYSLLAARLMADGYREDEMVQVGSIRSSMSEIKLSDGKRFRVKGCSIKQMRD